MATAAGGAPEIEPLAMYFKDKTVILRPSAEYAYAARIGSKVPHESVSPSKIAALLEQPVQTMSYARGKGEVHFTTAPKVVVVEADEEYADEELVVWRRGQDAALFEQAGEALSRARPDKKRGTTARNIGFSQLACKYAAFPGELPITRTHFPVGTRDRTVLVPLLLAYVSEQLGAMVPAAMNDPARKQEWAAHLVRSVQAEGAAPLPNRVEALTVLRLRAGDHLALHVDNSNCDRPGYDWMIGCIVCAGTERDVVLGYSRAACGRRATRTRPPVPPPPRTSSAAPPPVDARAPKRRRE